MLIMNKKGFTLTEVIIVLVILGALALILVPSIMNMMPDDHNIKYKKAFYTIQEIVSDIANDPSICQGMVYNMGNDSWNVATHPEEILSLCWPNGQGTTIAQQICEKLQTTGQCNNVGHNYCSILTTNNMRWNLSTFGGCQPQPMTSDSQYQYTIYVDVDGCGNNNNFIDNCVGTATDANNGVYGITINSDGRVIPATQVERNLLYNNPTN